MKKKKSCNNPTAQNDSVIIKNGFTENIDVLSTITTSSSDQIMASDSLKNRDRTSLIGDSSPVNGEIIENLTPELLLQEKLGTKPKQTNDSSRIELVKYYRFDTIYQYSLCVTEMGMIFLFSKGVRAIPFQ